MKIGEIKVDPAKIEAGAWVDEIPEFDGVRLKVRGLGCEIACNVAPVRGAYRVEG